MRTIKRNVNEVNTSLSSYTKLVKYHNQLEWKGIVENKNLFTTDQLSQADAKNVYVDDHGSLVSRPVVLRQPINEDYLPLNHELIDVIKYSNITIYISNEEYNFENHYKIIAVGDTVADLGEVQEYHISTIENYIICFNNLGAKILDINNQSAGWQDLSNFVEVPVIKRVVGGETQTYNKNQFTDAYKEEYILSNTSNPLLPTFSDRDNKNLVDMKINDTTWKLWKPNILPYYRTLKPINYTHQDGDLFSAAKGKICVGRKDYVLVSLDGGSTFTQVLYPAHGTWLNVASISDDGGWYFFVASDAVYRLDLGTFQWIAIYPHNDNTKSIGNIFTPSSSSKSDNGKLWHFLTKDVFAFVLWTNDNEGRETEFPILWFLGPNIAGYDTVPDLTKNDTITVPRSSLVDTKYRGTLGCSIGLAHEALTNIQATTPTSPISAASIALSNRPSDDNEISDNQKRENNPTYLKIFLDSGPVYTNGTLTDSSISTNGVSEVKDYASIIVSLPVNYGFLGGSSVNGVLTYVLPGCNCPDYIYNNKHVTEPLNIRIDWGPGGDLEPRHGLASLVGYRNYNTNIFSPFLGTLVEGFSMSSNRSLTELRVEKVYNASEWLIGEHKGDKASTYGYKGLVQGIFTISGKMYFYGGSTTNTNSGWYDFIWQIGYWASGDGQSLTPCSYLSLSNKYNPYTVESGPFINAGSTYYYTRFNEVYGTPIPLGADSLLIANFLNYVSSTGSRENIFFNEAARDWRNYQTVTNPQCLGNVVDGSTFYIRLSTGEVYTNTLTDEELAVLTYTYPSTNNYTDIPDVSYSSTELYLGFDNKLSITMNTRDDNGNILLSLPTVNDQKFIENITNIINISTTEVALFFENNIIICSKVQDETLGYRYDYYPTKLSTGTRLGDSVINTIEGTYTIFPTKRGLAFMNYQAFMATTDQVLTYITDNIEDRYQKFYDESDSIKIIQMRDRIYLTNGTDDILIYDLARGTWWYWQISKLHDKYLNEPDRYYTNNIKKLYTDQVELFIIGRERLFKFGEPIRVYKDYELIEDGISYGFTDFGNSEIEWFIMSQPLHMNAPNYYKNLKQLVFQLLDDNKDNKQHTIVVQIQCYRKKLDTKEPELIAFKIDELRTFVKRFNYWKINEVQYALANDKEAIIPTRLRLNGVSIKYELGEEVR